ncbi:unnamed protein product [Ixodes hexagonus]
MWVPALLALACSSCVIAEPNELEDASWGGVVRASNDFGLSLYTTLANGSDGNLLFSPWSLSRVLTMVLLGARNETAAELSRALALDSVGDAHVALAAQRKQAEQLGKSDELATTSMALTRVGDPVSAEYLANLDRYLDDGGVMQVDFSRADELLSRVNGEVSRLTGGRIRDALRRSPDPLSKLLLLNAVHFKSVWAKAFNPNDTFDGIFRGATRNTPTRMMAAKGKFRLSYDGAAYVLELPYTGDSSLVVALPRNRFQKDLEDVELRLPELLTAPPAELRSLELELPALLRNSTVRRRHNSHDAMERCAVVALLLVVAAADREAVSRASNALGLSLYRELAESDSKGGNVFLSPVSVAAILGMVQLGARGRTRQELDKALAGGSNKLGKASGDDLAAGFGQLLKDLRAEKGYDLRIASAVFIASGLPIFERYKKDLDKHFGSGIYSADFAGNGREAAQDVNNWVRDMTEDRIPEILERPLPPSAPLLVLNAVYFRGLWLNPFNPNETRKVDFYNRGTRAVPADMMHVKEELVYAYSDTLDADILELPYQGDRVVMVLVLPRKRDGLEDLERRFALEPVREALAGAVTRKVDVQLPKFQLQLSYSLRSVLRSLGVREAFNAQGANLSGISASRRLSLDEVLHKALLDVDEQGTEAVALSSGIVRHSRPPEEEVQFKADHPFIFFIEDVRSQTLLFLGRLQEV